MSILLNALQWSCSMLFFHFNAFAWIASNVLVAYIAIVLLIFVSGYYILFDPKATTAGRFVFRFMVSLLGVIALVSIGVFLDPIPGRLWYEYPGDVLWWRPALRLLAYTYVAFSITALAVVLALRKWWPEKIITAERDTVKPRNDK